MRRILKAPKLLKHRVLFAVIYDCGLRISEVINLKISDVDFDRRQVHIRESKCKKDRYVPVSGLPAGGIDKQGQWRSTKQDGDFLFDVKQLSNVFSARFARKLRRLKREGEIK